MQGLQARSLKMRPQCIMNLLEMSCRQCTQNSVHYCEVTGRKEGRSKQGTQHFVFLKATNQNKPTALRTLICQIHMTSLRPPG